MPLSLTERARLVNLVMGDLIGATITDASVDVAENGDITLQEVCLKTDVGDEIAINIADNAPAMMLRVNDPPKGWRRVSVDRDYDVDLWEDA